MKVFVLNIARDFCWLTNLLFGFYKVLFRFLRCQIKANAVRALGNLSRFVPFPGNSIISNETMGHIATPLINFSVENLSKLQNVDQNSKSFQPGTSKASDWLEKMVQAFVSCVTTGNVKVIRYIYLEKLNGIKETILMS